MFQNIFTKCKCKWHLCLSNLHVWRRNSSQWGSSRWKCAHLSQLTALTAPYCVLTSAAVHSLTTVWKTFFLHQRQNNNNWKEDRSRPSWLHKETISKSTKHLYSVYVLQNIWLFQINKCEHLSNRLTFWESLLFPFSLRCSDGHQSHVCVLSADFESGLSYLSLV